MAKKALDEADVGISCYVSPLPGFRGILKQRYSDFIVNEVGCEGNVVHLTSLDPPDEDVEVKEEKAPDSVESNYDSVIELFRSLAGEADAELLKDFLSNIAAGDVNGSASIVLYPDTDKAHRTEIHNFIKKNLKFLTTDVVEETPGGLKCIRVRRSGGERRGKGRSSKKRKERGDKFLEDDKPFDDRGSDNWPEHQGKFLRFHLCKENKDTQEALGVIGKMLGIQQRSFGFAGTKDKRSISTQRVTVFKQHAKKLAALNSRLIGIKIGNFFYVNEGLVLGQLSGNQFTITLRGVVADSEDTIKAAVEALGKNGFINYFGLQRFGSGSVATHLIGAALLRGEWKVAIGLILDPRDGERVAIREARDYYKESGDIEGTLRRLPRYLVAERAILQCLKKCPGNYLQALKAIPRTLRMMYVHSYQSYLWNNAASLRVQRHGAGEVVVGDLVYCKGGSQGKLAEFNVIEPEDVSYNDVHSYDIVDEITESSIPEEKAPPVKALNAADLIEGGYTIDDVLLPLPGSRVLYPENDIADVYQELAKKDSISLTESVHSTKEFSITCMTGGYRRVFQCPTDFSWELLSYTDTNIPLAKTDLDFISKTRPGDKTNEQCVNGGGYQDQSENFNNEKMSLVDRCEAVNGSEVGLPQGESICNSDAQSPQLALKLVFTLPTSCYATMAVRELLKSSTSAAFQKTLN